MAKGRQGFLLEFYKFGVYLMIPIGASIYFNDPERQKRNAEYWQFIKYPPSDPEKVRKEVEERIKQEKKQKEQQKAYKEQMKILQESAERSRRNAAKLNESQDNNNNSNKSGGLWGWLGFRQKKDE